MSPCPFDPLASTAPLIVYIDYKSPYAYLAKDPTYAIADELGVEIDWRPFTLDIPSYLGSARLDSEGRVVESKRSTSQWAMVKYAYRDARRYASMRGMTVRGTTKIWDSSLAGIGMLWAKEQGRDILRAYSGLVYERFWKRELDIEDIAVVEATLGESGARVTGFRAYAAGEGRAIHDEIQRAAFNAGIFGVPTYVVGGEVFFGREHLPRIRWLLTGRRGAPPDVAYESCSNATLVTATRGPLGLVIDFRSPYAYLAVGPSSAMAQELGVAIDWQPFLGARWKILAPASRGDDRATRHRSFRAAYMERDVMRYAAQRGLVLRGLDRRTDSTLAALGLLWVKRASPSLAREYIEHVFEGHFAETLDIEDELAIRAILARIGAPVLGFETFINREGRAELQGIQAELREAGIFDAPTYRLGGESFVGRQHLPLIRDLLSNFRSR
jgi:2-hydroxychromene-2-carboxylate isomerase